MDAAVTAPLVGESDVVPELPNSCDICVQRDGLGRSVLEEGGVCLKVAGFADCFCVFGFQG